ncbi:hypothetical protein AGOR_G00213780 [Albula goreensis]|uniref:Fibronectin type-III domain-containing protein n=1 Tax=Albula goreensis TaxID=1534307 RepID=A0A8T3CUX7_9TELE|nr:hypothetical protein AGOR_G00213780 [Albula goreensis]
MDWVSLTIIVMLLFLTKASSIVPPPRNITVMCHNFETMVYWNHSDGAADVRFNVNIVSYRSMRLPVDSCWNTTERKCNVSSLILSKIQDNYHMSITALRGSAESQPAMSADFTYILDLKEELLCSVDFPPVNVSISDRLLKVRFINPYRHYRAAFRKDKNQYNGKFQYTLIHANATDEYKFECQPREPICEGSIPLADGEETQCVMPKGNLKDIHFTAAEKICQETQKQIVKENQMNIVLYVLAPVVAFIFLATFVVLMSRRLTQTQSSIPKSMASWLTNPRPVGGSLLQPESEITSEVLSVEPSPSYSMVQEPHLQDATGSTTIDGGGSRFRIGVVGDQSASEKGEQQQEEPEQKRHPEYDHRHWQSTDYDRTHVPVPMEMSPGDSVVGYTHTQS